MVACHLVGQSSIPHNVFDFAELRLINERNCKMNLCSHILAKILKNGKNFEKLKINEIQLKSDETAQLLNKPYVNEVTLSVHNPP